MSRRLSILAAGVLLMAVGACGSAGSPTSPTGDEALSILEPASGAAVSAPFTVRVRSNRSLGAAETGNHHVYIWFDGNEAKHQISYGDTAQVADVPAGEHRMTVSLRNADHSDAGPRVEIPLTVADGPPPGY